MTPQQRTRENLTLRGYLVGSVERKKRFPARDKHACKACGNQPMIEISSDLWEIFDIVALRPKTSLSGPQEIVFVQTTTRTNHSTRRNKILSSMEAKLVLLSGAKILIQSWQQPDGEYTRWQACDELITLDMYSSASHYPNTVTELMEIKRKDKKGDLPPGSTIAYGPIKDSELPF